MAAPILPLALLGGGLVALLATSKKGESAPSGGSDPIVYQTPGIAPTGQPPLDPLMKTSVANALKALGVDPVTGQVTGQPTPEAIEAATSLASMLEANGYKQAADQLRAIAAQAAARQTVPTPAPLQQLPPELSSQLARAMSLEGDPKRIRALVAAVRKTPFASNPQVMATLAALEARAAGLEAAIDAVQTAADVQTVLTTPTSQPLPAPKPIPVPPPIDPAPLPTPSVPATYTVKTGDNPSKVAKAFTGDATRWRELQAANKRYDFNKQFWTGMVLTIPPSWRTSSSPAPSQGSTSVPLAVTTPGFVPGQPVPTSVNIPAAAPAAPSVPATYTVQSGDWPAKVAEKFTGDPNRWRELDKANPNYDLSKKFWAGMVLQLPASWR